MARTPTCPPSPRLREKPPPERLCPMFTTPAELLDTATLQPPRMELTRRLSTALCAARLFHRCRYPEAPHVIVKLELK